MADLTTSMLEISAMQASQSTSQSTDAEIQALMAQSTEPDPSKSVYVDAYSKISDFTKTLIDCQSAAILYLKKLDAYQLNNMMDDDKVKEKIKRKVNMVSRDAEF